MKPVQRCGNYYAMKVVSEFLHVDFNGKNLARPEGLASS